MKTNPFKTNDILKIDTLPGESPEWYVGPYEEDPDFDIEAAPFFYTKGGAIEWCVAHGLTAFYETTDPETDQYQLRQAGRDGVLYQSENGAWLTAEALQQHIKMRG